MVSAAGIDCQNYIFIIREYHDCSRDVEDELPNIAYERHFSAYCFRGTKQLKHVSCCLPFQKCTKSVYCQHMSIYLLALRKWLLLIVFNQADACMPDLQITCHCCSVSGRRKWSCNCSTEKVCLSQAPHSICRQGCEIAAFFPGRQWRNSGWSLRWLNLLVINCLGCFYV